MTPADEVRAVLGPVAAALDRDHLRRWSDALGVGDLLERAQRET